MEVRTIESQDGWLQYALLGEITCRARAEHPRDCLSPLGLQADSIDRNVVLDFSDATFLDSSGIGWLLSVNRAVKERGHRLAVVSVPPLIQRVMAMMRLGEVLTVCANTSDVRNRFGASG